MRALLTTHDEVLRRLIDKHQGHVFKHTGDGVAAVFSSAADATAAAVDAQGQLRDVLPVRMGLHTGEAELREGDYFGTAVNRAARIMSVAHGGQIVCSQPTADLARDVLGDRVVVAHLGEYRLRDLTNLERIFQVAAPGVVTEFPPLRSLDTLPGNLPRQVTSFIGRADEMESIAGLLAEHRVVTITGVGGVGKTRLALHVGAELLTDSPDGVWVAELAAVDDGDAMAEVIAAALGVTRRSDASLAAGIVDSLRSKQLLLVLDNCEHLLDEVAEFASDVMDKCSQVRILATSREGLGVAGERVWPLRSLGVPAPTDPVERIAASDAVQLLVDRARAVMPDFVLDDSNLAAVGEICRRLDGIPLAIELAAARFTAMQPREIAEHLDERFRLLTGGKRRGIERHQTLRATVDWSYSLLDDRDRVVFDRLAVFAGSFDAAAAQAVVADDGLDRFDVLDALNELVAKSMVVAEPGREGDTRYQLLETLRQYALERLDAHDAGDTARRRHADHYAQLAETAAPELLGRHELDWRPRINAEIDNFRAAVTWALDRDDPNDAELAMRIHHRRARHRSRPKPWLRHRRLGRTSRCVISHGRLLAASGRARGGGLWGLSPSGQRGRPLIRRARRSPTRRSHHVCHGRVRTRKHRRDTTWAGRGLPDRKRRARAAPRRLTRGAGGAPVPVSGSRLRGPRRPTRRCDGRRRQAPRRRAAPGSTDGSRGRALRQRCRPRSGRCRPRGGAAGVGRKHRPDARWGERRRVHARLDHDGAASR